MKLRAFSLLVLAALVVGWILFLRPVSLGGPASYASVTGRSMEPRLHSGDLVIAREQSSYGVGDVVVYRVPAGQAGGGSLIVHRIVGGDARSGFVLQGDNKDTPDQWRPTRSDILGKSWIELPGSGNALLILRRPIVLASVLGGVAFFFVLTAGSDRRRASRAQAGSER
jgi:signal peptidase